jgi:hypothetical protein
MATSSKSEFTVAEALEFADAYRRGMTDGEDVRALRANLWHRIDNIESNADEAPSYLYAALRGYEAALAFHTGDVSPVYPTLVSLRFGVQWDMDARHEAPAIAAAEGK